MAPLLDYLTAALVTLLVVVDPPGLGPIFLGVTRGMNKEQQHSVGWRASVIGFGVLAFFAIAGEPFLRLLGITTPAFRIAGGLLLFAIAYEMVFDRSNTRKSETAETAITKDFISNVAAFPLAIPLIAGPGAITAVMLLSAQAHGEPAKFASLFLVIAFVTACCYVSFRLAGVINKLLGITGNVVLTRLLGIVLSALAVQFIVDGVRAIVAG
ncbi:MarC family protein [Labrys sp. 22185]|uniref:MarC family protein n=1 Tax=Labrys sp. 22185 TaxID=3453888 RepID=UPI003F844AA0